MTEAAKKPHLKPAEDLPNVETFEPNYEALNEALADFGDGAARRTEPVVEGQVTEAAETRKAFIQNRAHYRQQVDERRDHVRLAEAQLQDALDTLAFYERGLAMPAEDKGEPEKEAGE